MRPVYALLSLAALGISFPAFAQDKADSEATTTDADDKKTTDKSGDADGAEKSDAEKDDAKEKGDDAKADKKGGESGAIGDPKKDIGTDDDDLSNKKNETEYFLGMRFRDFIAPSFIFDLFVDGGATVNVFTFGPEFTVRTGNFDIELAATYGDFSMDEVMFKSKKDEPRAYEVVSSDLKMLSITVDLLGNIALDKERKYSILIGGGVGLGGVLGNIYRSQAYPKDPNKISEERSDWVKCAAVGDPAAPQNGVNWCDNSNENYNDHSEPSWANGGSKPFLFPYIALPHLAFRAQPIEHLQMRVDTGFSIYGFFFGFGAGGKLPI